MKRAIRILGVFCILATLIPFIPSDFWFVRMFDFPHVQLTVLTLLALMGFPFFFSFRNKWEMLLGLLLTGAFIYQASIIYPYTPLAKCQVLNSDGGNDTMNISLLSSNVLMKNDNYGKLLETIRQNDPDIIILLEADKKWQEAVSEIKETYKYSVEEPLDNTYGLLFYSRLKLINPQVKYLVKEGIPSVETEVELHSGKRIRLYAVHPEPPSPTENEKSTERDGELMIVGKKVAKADEPVIVIGDLNDVAWSYTTRLFQEISHLLDPRIGRGFYNTFNAKYPLMRWPLDHVFHSNHFKLVEMKRLPEIDSDHFPIYVKLSFEPEADEQQEEPTASPEKEKQAAEMIDEVK